jgi:outer membrane protein, heavy metal efflux system
LSISLMFRYANLRAPGCRSRRQLLKACRKFHTPRLPSVCVLGVLVLAIEGCASLDARPEIERSAAHIEHATNVSGEMLLLDSEAARAKTAELLRDGLSAEEAVQVALLNNPRSRAAILSVGISRADFVQSTLFTNPTLALSLRFPEGGGLANFETSLTQNLAELWLVPVQKKVAQRRLDRTILEAALNIADIAYAAQRAYVRAIKAREREAIARETVQLAEQLHEVAKLRQQAGTGTELDVNLARIRQLEANASFRDAQLAAFEARADLARALGLADRPDTLQLIATLPQPMNWTVTAEMLQQVAIENRLDLRIAEQTVQEAQWRAKEERRRFLKSVEGGLALERSERPSGDDGGDIIAGPTLALELPLWDRNQAQIARADRVLEQTIQLRDALIVDAAQDIHSRLARVQTASQNAVYFRDELLPAAERIVSLSRMAYQIGWGSFLSVLEAERSFLAAKEGYLEALESAAMAMVELEQATGRPVSALLALSEAEEHNHARTSKAPTE